MIPFRQPSTDILYIAIALSVAAFLCMLVVALRKIWEGDPMYLIILIFGVSLLLIALWPVRGILHYTHNHNYKGKEGEDNEQL